MRRIIAVLLLVVTLLLTGCEMPQPQYEEHDYKITEKNTAIESKYNWWFDKFEVYTAYYFILENGQVIEIELDEYVKYEVGDKYTVTVKVEK